MPKVSVIIPVYGVEKYIERCARSLFEQTMTDIEFIFVDDCTPDRSMEILKRIIDEYRPRFAGERKSVRIERMPTNSGLAAVRRRGMQLAQGDYIIHCDSDDWVNPDMYRILYEEAVRMDADIVMCGYKVTDGKHVYSSECSPHFTDKHKLLSDLLTLHESWSVWNKLCKRSLCDSSFVYPALAMGEDMVLTIQLALKAKRIGVVPKALYNYFYNPDSITNVQSEYSRYKHWKDSAENSKIVLSIFQKLGLAKEYASELEYLKYLQKRLAGNLARNKKYCKEWLQMFSEINWSVLHNRYIDNMEKVKFLINKAIAGVLKCL